MFESSSAVGAIGVFGLLRRTFALGVLLTAAGLSHAQAPSTAPIRILVGFPAGAGTDAIARMLGEQLKDILGVPIVIENRAGAGGQIAWADPESGISFAYVTNGLDAHVIRQGRRGIALSSYAAVC